MAPLTTQEAAIQANLRQIMAHESKPNPKPMSATSVTRGFEAVAYPKIVRELHDHHLVVRQKALLAARELLGSPTGYAQCIAAHITPAVIRLLKDPDPIVRERAAGTAEYLVTKELGARDLIQHGGVYQLVSCLTDTSRPVRDAAYQALIEAARFDPVRREITSQNALVELMALVLEEEQHRAVQGLVLLNECVQVRHNDAALEQLIDNAGAIPALVGLFDRGKDAVSEQAAQLMGLLTSRFNDAKIKAVKEGAVPRLLVLLQSPKLHLAQSAATALMAITVAREGKYAVIEAKDGLKVLASRLDPLKQQLCVDVMEIITNVAEAPEARPVLVKHGAPEALLAIHSKAGVEDTPLRRSAAQALRQCGFKHLPFDVLRGRQIPEELLLEPAEDQEQGQGQQEQAEAAELEAVEQPPPEQQMAGLSLVQVRV